MATTKMLEFIIGLVIVVIVFIALGGCISQILNPKCDLRASDAFDDFIELYKNCIDVKGTGVCRCGDFNINELPLEHKIVITPSTKKDIDEKIVYEAVRVSLVCNERNADNYYFGNYEKSERIRAYFDDPTKFWGEDYKKNYESIFDEIKQGSHISDKLLGQGIEIDPDFKFPIGKGEGLELIFAGDSKLSLVNYNGQVAFAVKAGSQGEKNLNLC